MDEPLVSKEVYYSIDQQEHKNQIFFVVNIAREKDFAKRLLYRDTLQSLEKDKEAAAFLIKHELMFLGISPLSSQASTAVFNKVRIAVVHSNEAIKILAKTGKLFWKGKKLIVDPFTLLEFFYEASFEEDGSVKVKGRLRGSGKEEDLSNVEYFSQGKTPWLIKLGVWQALAHEVDWKWIDMVYPEPKVLEGKKRDQFLDQFEDGAFCRAPKVVWKNKGESISEPSKEILPSLVLHDRSGAFADLWMDYGPLKRVAFHDVLLDSWRDLQAEKSWEKDLLETDFTKKIVGSSHYYCPLDKVSKSLTFLLEIGWKIFDHQGKRVFRQSAAELDLRADGQDILVRGRVSYDHHHANLSDILGSFNRRERFVNLSPDAVGLIDEAKAEREWQELAEYENGKEAIAIRKSHFGLLESFFKDPSCTRDQEISKLAAQWDRKKGIELSLPGSGFNGKLHSYQQDGVDWLAFLYQGGFHGLLADEMGLGKTVQLLAFFSSIQRTKPILIVVPTSLLFNWRREIEKFLPKEEITIHSGSDRLRSEEALKNKNMILTSYALLRLDASFLQNVDYECVVLDEAQNIKNSESLSAQSAFNLSARMRIAVTGTPIENRWDDLWSLFHFLNPSLLGPRQEFGAKMVSAQSDSRYLTQVKKKIRPFILRRTKEEVAEDLPPKYEQVVWTEMQESQRNIYEKWLSEHRSGLLKKVKEDGLRAHRMEILEAILRLRQICCHPHLVDSSLDRDDLEISSKLDRVIADMETIVEENHKVLIYSQFTQMLRLIERQVKSKNWKYVYLDGSTKDREEIVQKFQEDPETSIFLISLKAGGVGLNLTAADYVFIFDPWWNEAVERQAIDRAHRFGRKKKVIARRYVISNSIEEKMMRLKERKSTLADSFLDLEGKLEDLTLEDLLELIS